MNLITKLFLLSLLIPAALSAQSEASSVNTLKWSMLPQWPNVSMMYVSAYNSSGSEFSEGITTGILKVDDNAAISNVQLDGSHYGVVRLNRNLSTQWLTPIDGYPISIGFFAGKVFVIASTEMSSYKGIGNDYTGYMIDPKTGQISMKKAFFSGGDKFYQQPVFLYAPDGSFFKMAIRTSNFTWGIHNPLLMFKMNKVAEAYFETNEFKLIEFDSNLEIKSTIKPVLEQGYFIGGTTNRNGDIFLLSDYSQGIIKVAQYQNGKTVPSKVLKIPVSINDDIISNLKNNFLLTSKKDPSILFFAGTYRNVQDDRELVVAKLNFKDGAVTRNIQAMDKAYLKETQKAYVPFNKKLDDANLGSKDDMRIRNIVENDGKVIVALSSFRVSSNPNTHSTISAFGLLINIYDDKSNLQYQQIIPRNYETFGDAWLGIGMHCRDNVLYLTANNNKGLFGYKVLYSQVDLKTGAVTNIIGIEKSDIRKHYPANPSTSIWFDKQFILSYMEEKGLFDSSQDAHLQLVNY